MKCSIFSDGEYYLDCQCCLATSGNLVDTPGSIPITAYVKGDAVPLFFYYFFCPIYIVKS
jgi:hypothetical protein